MLKKKQVFAAALMTGSLMASMAIPYGVAAAGQPPTARPDWMVTATTSVPEINTSTSWTAASSDSSYFASGSAIVECANSAWTTGLNSTGAKWIWDGFNSDGCTSSGPANAPVGSVTLSTTFTINGGSNDAIQPMSDVTLQYAVDNAATITLNGNTVAVLSDSAYVKAPTNFDEVHSVSIPYTDFVVGTNVLSVTAENTATTGNVNPAGFIASMSSFTATAVTTLTSVAQCEMGGWQYWQNPSFVNEGDCVSYVVSHGNDPAQG